MDILIAVIGSAVAALLAAEFRSWAPLLSRLLVRLAVTAVHERRKERLREEWSAFLGELPGDLARLAAACGFVAAALWFAAFDSPIYRCVTFAVPGTVFYFRIFRTSYEMAANLSRMGALKRGASPVFVAVRMANLAVSMMFEYWVLGRVSAKPERKSHPDNVT